MQRLEFVERRINDLEEENVRLRKSINKDENKLTQKKILINIGNFFVSINFILFVPTVLIWVGVILKIIIGKNIFYRYFQSIFPELIWIGFTLGFIPGIYLGLMQKINESYRLEDKKSDAKYLINQIKNDKERLNNNINELRRLKDQKQHLSDVSNDLENLL